MNEKDDRLNFSISTRFPTWLTFDPTASISSEQLKYCVPCYFPYKSGETVIRPESERKRRSLENFQLRIPLHDGRPMNGTLWVTRYTPTYESVSQIFIEFRRSRNRTWRRRRRKKEVEGGGKVAAAGATATAAALATAILGNCSIPIQRMQEEEEEEEKEEIEEEEDEEKKKEE
uniref:Uncharacterized protein n=1 Tax=Vespula pensylvanica TaxID=30213 RepID=A0A834P580_VESPE|nr:hypothetical protein H0235_007190 [Vespula pensylvanica]